MNQITFIKKSLSIALAWATILTITQAQTPEELVNSFFKGMLTIDTISVKKCFISEPSFHTSGANRLGAKIITGGSLPDFLKTIAAHKAGELDERISNLKTYTTDDATTVSMDYSFFYKGKFSHCGVNVFHMLKDDTGWKVTGIDDTRQKNDCIQTKIDRAGLFLDEWHMDATRADSAAYFSKLNNNSVFIGTDSSEVWNKQQFAKFAGPYFAKGKAWDFKKISRNMHYNEGKKMIWFDEMLSTWMGPCRGSGFIDVSDDGQFSIMQYVLSVTVPNDKINGVIEVIKGK